MLVERASVTNFRSFGRTQHFRPHRLLSVLVGPNEAGKSSLLEALTCLDTQIASDQVRVDCKPEETSVVVILEPEETDREALKKEGVALESVQVKSTAETTYWTISPTPRKRPFTEVESLFDEAVEELGPYGRSLEAQRERATEVFGSNHPDRSTLKQTLEGLAKQPQAGEAVANFNEQVLSPSPWELAVAAIRNRLPAVVEFSDEQRGLKSSYPLAEPQPGRTTENRLPLLNICKLAGLDINELPAQIGRRDNLFDEANEALRAEFSRLWGSDKPWPRLSINNNRLHISARDPQNPNQDGLDVSDRSDGVIRMFELIAFVGSSTPASSQRVLVLADEIEQHLHYDAQVELVEWLELGALNAQVVATTHSIGCWPSDIGSQMNALQRVDGESKIWNGPYSNTATGGTGIMSAVGASRAAVSIHRPVVFCEGRIDEMLLPALFQDADCDVTGVWFVGSISQSKRTIPPSYPSVPFETLLLDADEGGTEMREQLIESDPSRGSLCHLINENPALPIATVEDLVDFELAQKLINEWWEDCYDTDEHEPPELDPSEPIVEQLRTCIKSIESDPKIAKSVLNNCKSHLADQALNHSREGSSVARSEYIEHLAQLWEKAKPN